MSTMTIPRGWRFADHVPWCMPESLDDLHGPASGLVRTTGSICTAPDPVFNLDDPADFNSMYRATVRDGTAAEQERFLDRDTLIRLWPELFLPYQCRDAWEARFPILKAANHGRPANEIDSPITQGE